MKSNFLFYIFLRQDETMRLMQSQWNCLHFKSTNVYNDLCKGILELFNFRGIL